MQGENLRFNVVMSALIFSVIFAVAAYHVLLLIPGFIYQIIVGLVFFILYVNILRLFIFEMLSLKQTRVTEILSYTLMYGITAGVIAMPFIFDSVYVYESNVIRFIIIFFASTMLLKYFTYMVLGPLQDIVHEVRHVKKYKDIAYNPSVSVLIPAWNEEVGILDTLRSLIASTYTNLELVVINDGSTDNSDQKIREFIIEHTKTTSPISITYEYKKNGGKASALNRALEIASGDIIVTIDADSIVESNTIAEFVEEFKDPTVMAAVGNVKIGNNTSTLGVVQYLEFLFSFYFKRAESLLGSIYIIGGAAGAFRREVFEEIGNYSTQNLTEDIELSVRIQDAGMKIAYVPKAVVHTEGASDLDGLKKQRLRWKRGRFQTFFQYRHLFFSRKKEHNTFLSFFVMPMAVLQEIHLLLEIPFLIFLYGFSVLNNDYLSFVVGIFVVGAMFVVQMLFFEKSTRTLSFVLLAPIGWLIFYIATYVEAYALFKSIGLYLRGQELTWQQWERKGIGVRNVQST